MFKKKSKKKAEALAIPLSVLGYQDKDKEWVALALEMDLRGYGKTFDKALAELEETIEEQIKFAIYKKDFSLLDHTAEDRYFRMFREARGNSLYSYMKKAMNDKGSRHHKEKAIVQNYKLPAPEVIASQKENFSR